MKPSQWIGAILMGTGLGLLCFAFVLFNNLLTSRLQALVVTSGSMEPALPVGSAVITKSQPAYFQSDVVAFTPTDSRDNIVTHRIDSKTYTNSSSEPTFLTKGDANEDTDNWQITQGQILGKVILTIPYLGYAVNFVKTPTGFVALIIIPASIIIYEELKVITWEIKNFLTHIFKRKGRGNNQNSGSSLAITLPIIGAVMLMISTSSSYLYDKVTVKSNSVAVATSYPSPTITATSSPFVASHIVLNEIFYDVDSLHGSETTNEWVELYNPTLEPIDISGWKIHDNTGQDTLPSTPPIPAGGYTLIINNPGTLDLWSIPLNTVIITLNGPIDNGLSNTGDSLTLYDANNNEIDSYAYENESADEGHSIGRVPDGQDLDSLGDFIELTEPSPGGPNYE